MAAGAFREDLYYRLSVAQVSLPALHERAEDIPLLLERFLAEFARKHGKSHPSFSESAHEVLIRHSWPGNIRELRNVVEQSVILAEEGRWIESDKLGSLSGSPTNGQAPAWRGPTKPMHQVEKEHILQTLQTVASNRTKAAELLQISVRTLRNKLHEYRLQPS